MVTRELKQRYKHNWPDSFIWTVGVTLLQLPSWAFQFFSFIVMKEWSVSAIYCTVSDPSPGVISFSLQQNYPDSSASTENKRPSNVEKADDPDKYFHVPPVSNTCRNLLLPNLGSPVRRTSLGNLLGEELLQFNTLRHCRSPVRCWTPNPSPKHQTKVQKQTLPPTSTPKSTHRTQADSGGTGHKPAKLLIPTLNCFGPPDLSPR